jgi:hypothetical protein
MANRALAVILAIPLSVVGAAGVALHLCQSMGGAMIGGCDCERSDGHEAHGEHGDHAQSGARQALQAQPCCTVEFAEVDAFVGASERSEALLHPAPVSIAGFAHVLAWSSRLDSSHGLLRERAPPEPRGPALFLRHCVFLT